MTVLVDAGNTSIKWQRRRANEVVSSGSGEVTQLLDWMDKQSVTREERVAVSCVRSDAFASDLRNALLTRGVSRVEFAVSVAECRGVLNAYVEPATLGVDRWLAMLAMKARGHDSAVVIDIGTACTIDILQDGHHLGGYILPGPALARESLIRNTDKIRFSTEPSPSVAPGSDTGACVVSGAWLMMVASVKEVAVNFPKSPIYLTGGGASALSSLGVEGSIASGLVFDGLHFWLNGT